MEQYDLEVRAVSKGRESYICDTTQGQLLLKEYKGSAERAEFLSAILGHLGGQGLLTEQVVRTKEDAPIAVVEDETKYMVLTAVSGSECDTRNRADMIAGAEKLAMLHNAAETYSETVPEFVCNDPNELQELYEKHNRELVKVRNYIRSKKKKNDFEVLFYGQYERFMEKARQVAQELSAMGQGGQSAGFCHGDYNQHNILFSKTGIGIVHFECFSYQIQVSDLANYMRKMLEKNNWNIDLGRKVLAEYESEKIITQEEHNILNIMFSYPEKFWKIINYYFNSNKAWYSEKNEEKLKQLQNQEEIRKKFIASPPQNALFLLSEEYIYEV
mgnify:CR=1 FL=1